MTFSQESIELYGGLKRIYPLNLFEHNKTFPVKKEGKIDLMSTSLLSSMYPEKPYEEFLKINIINIMI